MPGPLETWPHSTTHLQIFFLFPDYEQKCSPLNENKETQLWTQNTRPIEVGAEELG